MVGLPRYPRRTSKTWLVIMEIKFKNIGGIWYAIINNSQPQRYHELSDSEKQIFNNFIKEFKTH